MNTLSDLELWLLVKQGDNLAFEEIYNRYWEKLYSQCYWHLMDQEGAKDIVQELFVHLWDKRNEIHIEQTMGGYFKIAIRNRIFNHIRSTIVKRNHLNAAGRHYDDANNSTEEKSKERELNRLYQEEIQKLPPKMKEVFTLNKEAGLSITEMAERFSVSEQTIKNQLTSALKKVRAGLEHYYRPLFLLIFLVSAVKICS